MIYNNQYRLRAINKQAAVVASCPKAKYDVEGVHRARCLKASKVVKTKSSRLRVSPELRKFEQNVVIPRCPRTHAGREEWMRTARYDFGVVMAGAQRGDIRDQYVLGMFFARGYGCAKNAEIARNWKRLAIAAGFNGRRPRKSHKPVIAEKIPSQKPCKNWTPGLKFPGCHVFRGRI